MKFINKQEGLQRKYQRQLKLLNDKRFSIDCKGSCSHLDKIPFGCSACLFTNIMEIGLFVGVGANLPNYCNADCIQCFTPKGNSLIDKKIKQNYTIPDEWFTEITKSFNDPLYGYSTFALVNRYKYNNYKNILYSFSGEGSEPLLYLDVIRKFMSHYINDFEQVIKKRGYAKLYTNGKLLTKEVIKKLQESRIDEIRINPSAFNFSKEIFDNVKNVIGKIPTVCIEVPIFPFYQEKIFEMLPLLNDIGIDHLTLCQVKIKDKKVFNKLISVLDDKTECYQADNTWIVLEDKGFCEKVINECIKKNYSFSVMDCNALTISLQNTPGLSKDLNNEDFNKVIRKVPIIGIGADC